MSLHADACAVLAAFDHRDPAQLDTAAQYLAFLDAHPDGTRRECREGHITASALVIDRSGEHVLLTLHPKVGRWLQLGGHLEPEDAHLRAGAVRETIEESGLQAGRISAVPVRLDRHPVPCGRGLDGAPLASEHLDVQFVVQVPEALPPTISAESDDLRWFPRTALPTLPTLPTIDDSVSALIDDALAFAALDALDALDAPDALDPRADRRWVTFG